MHLAIIVKPPLTMPDPPIPATALPTINIFDEVATPQRSEPSSKRARKTIKQIMKSVSRNSGLRRRVSYLGVIFAIDFASHWL
jgi:hypothetical protein